MSIIATARERVAGTLAESVYDNAVVTREFRTRMRGKRAFGVMGSYVLFLSIVMSITYHAVWNESAHHSHATISMSQEMGRTLFVSLTWTQAILLSFIVPALTSSALTQELEKKTIEMLALTKLSPGKIVLGKQLSGFIYSLILLVCGIPLAGLCLLFGGISPLEIAITYLLLAAWAFLFTSAGVFWSSMFNRTATASLFSYGTCLAYALFTGIFGLACMESHWYRWGGGREWSVFTILNPGWASYWAAMTAKVCGISVMIALPPLILHVAIGTVMLLASSAHVQYCRAEKALPIRMILLAVTVFVCWLYAGQRVLAPAPNWGNDVIVTDCSVILVFMGLAAAVFATGRIGMREDESVMTYALSPSKVFKSDLGGGMSFMLLWAGVAYAALGATILWATRLQAAPVDPTFWPAYLKVSASALAIIAGICAVGVLASSLVKDRKSAAALVVVFVLLALAFYPIALTYYIGGVSSADNPLWQLAALWPLTPAFSLTDGMTNQAVLHWSAENSWIVTSAAYLLLGAAALGLAAPALAKYGGVREE